MFQWERFVNYEGDWREYLHAPSRVIQHLAKLEPKIAQESRGQLCEYTPKNFVGTLLVKLYQEEIIEICAECSIPPPDFILEPLKIISNSALWYYTPTTGLTRAVNRKDEDISTGRVLVKLSCGIESGVLLDPPLQGLIVSRIPDKKRYKRFCINRVWNDTPLIDLSLIQEWGEPYDFPYSMHIQASALAEYEVNEFLKERFRSLAKEHIFHSQAFVALCKTVEGIPLSFDSFHATRSVRKEDVPWYIRLRYRE